VYKQWLSCSPVYILLYGRETTWSPISKFMRLWSDLKNYNSWKSRVPSPATFVAIQLIIQTCTSLLRWRLNLALQVSQGSASRCFRWSGHFRHSFVKGLFRDVLFNFYSKRFIIIDRQRAKNTLAQFFETRCSFYIGLMFCLQAHRRTLLNRPVSMNQLVKWKTTPRLHRHRAMALNS